MAWTTPATAVTGDVITASFWNSNGRDNLQYLYDEKITSPSTVQGDVLYHSSSGWVGLAAGTSGTFLQSNGASANPAWASVSVVGARVYSSSAVLAPNNVGTAIPFGAERFDTNDFHSTSSNTTRLTVPAGLGGYYSVGGNVEYATNGAGRRFLGLFLNSSSYIGATQQSAASASVQTSVAVHTNYQLTAGDYVELLVLQDSGTDLNIGASVRYSPEFYMVRIGTT